MKFFVAFGVLALVIVADAGVSMHNPFFCYMTDPIRSMTNMHSTSTSYEAIRRFNFTTVNPYISSKFTALEAPPERVFSFKFCLACAPSKFWYLGRYGGRFPHATLMTEMIDFAESSVSFIDSLLQGDFCLYVRSNRFKMIL